MYNEKYISNFKDDDYLNYLKDRWALKEIADAYIKQYDTPTFDGTLAFKESLDHFVLKQLKNNVNFKNTSYFKNYLDYLNYIFSNRLSSGNTQLEYNTNIVFADKETKKLILSYYNEDTQNKLEEIIKQNENRIKIIVTKIEKKVKLSQRELNFLADYLYTKKDFNIPIYSKFIEYLLNEMLDNPQLNNSPQVIAGYMAYLPAFFKDGCENSRIFLTNGFSSRQNSILPSVLKNIYKQEKGKNKLERTINYQRIYSIGDKYVSVAKSEVEGLSLTSDKSLDISRTMKNKDLYWISMVCFHELSHQYQVRHRLVLNKEDYSNNHDSYEMEIEADENAWKKMFDYIVKFRLEKAKTTDRSYVLKQIDKCKKNQEAVYSRRTFLTKKFSSDSDYFEDDVQIIKNNFRAIKDYSSYFKKSRDQYPMVKEVFDEDGQIKSNIILNKNITSDMSGLNNNIIGSEIAKYILTNDYDELKKQIKDSKLTKGQFQNLMINIYNTYHLDKMYVRALDKVDMKQYDETQHNFDLRDMRGKYLERFISVAEMVYKERELAHIVKSKSPDYNVEQFSNPKYAIWNFDDMFNYLYNSSKGVIYESELDSLLTKYELSNDEVLVALAKKTRKVLIPKQMSNGVDLSKK